MVLLVMEFNLENLTWVVLTVMEENAWEVEAQRRRSPAETPGRLVNTGPHTAMMGLPECGMAIHTGRQATL